jgi:hypothetical protein
MTSGCPPSEDLAGIAELPANDPRRSHVDRCPRCRARLATYEEFLRAEGECDPAELSWALDRLGKELDRAIPPAGRMVRSDQPPARAKRTAPSFLRPAFARWALAAAAALLLFLGLNGIWLGPGAGRHLPGEIRLRGEGVARSESDLPLAQPTRLPDGGIELDWSAVPTVDHYQVLVLDARLEEIARVPADSNRSIRLAADRLRELLPGPGIYALVVIGESGRDEIARSQPASFRFDLRP